MATSVRTILPRLASLTVLLLLSGCGMTDQGPKYTEEELRSRPTYENAKNNYLAMLTEIRTELDTLVPTLEWDTPEPEIDEGHYCEGKFANLYATKGYYRLSATGGIPDAVWPEALAAVQRVAGEHGFQTTQVMADAPSTDASPSSTSHHDVSIIDPYETRLAFGSDKGTTVWVFGACFLPEEYWTLPPSHPKEY